MEPAATPSSASPEAPAKFTLPHAAWIAWLIYSGAASALFAVRRTAATPRAVGELIRNNVAFLIFPVLVAWIVWRLKRRSPSVVTPTFFAVFGLMLLGQAFQFAERVRANVEMQKIAATNRELQAAQQEALAKGRPLDETKARQLTQKSAEQWDKLVQTSSGQQRAAAEAAKAYLDRVMATKKRYDESFAKINADSFWDLSRYGSAALVAESRTAVQAFARANDDLAAQQDRDGTGLRREMEQRHVSADVVQEAIHGYQSSAGARLEVIAHIRETDAEFAKAMLAFLDLVDANLGKWKPAGSGGKMAFDSETAARRYRELLDQVKEIGDRQTQYKEQILAPKE